jgi:hypothetical protein
MSNFVKESKVMKKGEQMFPKVFPKLKRGFNIRKGPPSQEVTTSSVPRASAPLFMSFWKMRK